MLKIVYLVDTNLSSIFSIHLITIFPGNFYIT